VKQGWSRNPPDRQKIALVLDGSIYAVARWDPEGQVWITRTGLDLPRDTFWHPLPWPPFGTAYVDQRTHALCERREGTDYE
jgi:hypothetical protein